MAQETRLFCDPLGAGARERLRALVSRLKGDDPLAPVSVVVPSTYAALDLRHDLGRRGSANVHLLVLPRLTELLGAPALASLGLRTLTPLLEASVVRGVASEARGPLAPVAQHRALHHTLRTTFRDLRHATEAGLSALSSQGDLRAEVVRLFRRFRQQTDARYYDRETLAQASARSVRAGAAPGLRDLGPVVFYLLNDLSPGEVALVQALAERWTVAVILGLVGDDLADGPTLALADRLAPILGPAPDTAAIPAPSIARLLVAPDPQQEVRWVLRRLMRAAQEGMPFHRMAVLYRQPASYAQLVPEELALAGVPLAGPGAVLLSETAAGRTLLGLVRLVGTDLPRAELMAWLTGCPVRSPERPAWSGQAARWDAISRRAGVVGGPVQWQQRLERYAGELERLAEEGLERGDLAEARVNRMREEAISARSLLAFVNRLAEGLQPPPGGSEWSVLARWAGDLLSDYLARDSAPANVAELEETALRRIEETLAELRTLDEVEPGPSLEEFRLALEEALAAPLGHLGPTGQGVFVAPLGTVLGLSFDLVCVVGMVEGAMPPSHPDDPLLPEGERQRAGGLEAGIARHDSRGAEERYRYRSALAVGAECVLSFPRGNPGAQRGQFPSRWFLEAATQLHGAPVYSSSLGALADASWLTVVASLEDGLRSVDTEAAADQHDRDLYHLWRWRGEGKPLRAHHLAASGNLASALDLELGRGARRLTRWDGDVSALKDRARRLKLADRPVLSPTSLETWAACPFRYLMSHVLGVAALERPEEVWTISPLEKGSLVHGVLDGFIRRVQAEGQLPAPGHPWRPAHREQLRETAREAFAAAEASGATGKSLLWELERDNLLADLDAFLIEDTALRARFGVTPHRVEVAFGLSRSNGDGLMLPPAERQVAGVGTLRFRGAVDRLDLDPSGQTALVLDYKTGSASSYEALKKDPVDAGRRLQLPIYTLALQDYLGDGVTVSAAYWFVSARGKFLLLPPDPVELDRIAERFDVVVGAIAQGISAGLFPANPGPDDRDGFANCGWCDFDTLCSSRRDVLWQRKQADPRLREYLSLGAVPGYQEDQEANEE